jgi:hypothetical protein
VASGLRAPAERREDLVELRETSLLALREHELAVPSDLEGAALPFDQLGLDTQVFLERVRQTGGSRQVVSSDAILDGHVHDVDPPRV